MQQRISLITLGVDDLERALAFYEALGWRGQKLEDIVFFQAGGMAVGLWSRKQLGDDSGVALSATAGGFDGITLAQNVTSREEVDAILAAAAAAGAQITRPPADTFYGGYAGYFLDPDGHAWEIAHNPGFTLLEDGSLQLPDFGAS